MTMQAPAAKVEDAGSPPAPDAISIAPNLPRPAPKASRKRTKTGCLTCRKRRIKCGEERPVCVNCTKSKRNCEGYNHRVVFKQPSGAPHLVGHAPGSAGPVPLAPSVTSAWHASFAYPPTENPPPWGRPPTPKQTYEQSYANVASGLQAFPAFGPESSYPAHPPPPVTSTPGAPFAAPLGWDAPPGPGHPFDASTTLPRSLSAAYDELSARIPPTASPYGPPFTGQSYPSVPSTDPVAALDHPSRLRGDAFPSGHPPMEQALSATAEPARTFAPAPAPRQRSFSSDDWHQVSPLSAAASIRKVFTFGDTFDPARDYTVKHIKQEVVFPDNDRRRYSVHNVVQQTSLGGGGHTAAPPPASALVTDIKRDGEDDEYGYGYGDDHDNYGDNGDDDDADENDPWDVEMELSQTASTPTGDPQRELSMMLSRHATQDVARVRTFNTFLDTPNVLATYRPSPSSSPLRDENAARIFCHFVHVTGPCISTFERQASSSLISFHNSPIPQFPKTLWTYTLPSIALSHPPLMHAILAISSLHIAKLQGTSDAPSIKHFTYALRRVSKLIGLPKRRNEIPTMAANLLVGFYEILLADHSKWNIHLSGARILVMEIDFASMTRRLRRMRAEARERIARTPAFSYEDYIRIAGVPDTLLPDKDWEVDERLVSQLTGLPVDYDNHWQARATTPSRSQDLSAKDVEDYKVQQDLYWWYCKQDIFSSMVSGNRLLMPYEHWKYCPPRGQIGKLETTYATMDYLCLIMARLTDFGGKDQLRKRRVVAAQGGQWRPPPGFFGPGNPPAGPPPSHPPPPPPGLMGPPHRPPTTTAPRPPGHDPVAPSRPPFPSAPPNPTSPPHPPPPLQSRSQAPHTAGGPMYGMMPPPTGSIHMHSAFQAMTANIHDTGYGHAHPKATSTPTPTPSPSPTTTTGADMDLTAATALALAEHAAIATAFDLFGHLLANPEYAPLTPDTTPPIATPFGPAIQYRTHPISCIWAFYHVGRILLHRLHPHMPPAAMVSAGVCAHLTHTHAQTIGRICAGLYLPSTYSFQTATLNPSLGAALMESSFSLFFAGIQFQDPVQRGWTVSKLTDIARLTGWQTSATIAAGCEVCWERLGDMGKAPPYVATVARRPERDDGRTRRGEGMAGGGGPLKSQGCWETPKEVEEEPDVMINHDRRFINVNPSARVHWALGILGVEDDMRKLDLEKS